MPTPQEKLPHVIITGNPIDGFTLYGPFSDAITAAQEGDSDAHMGGDWWIAPIHPMEE